MSKNNLGVDSFNVDRSVRESKLIEEVLNSDITLLQPDKGYMYVYIYIYIYIYIYTTLLLSVFEIHWLNFLALIWVKIGYESFSKSCHILGYQSIFGGNQNFP